MSYGIGRDGRFLINRDPRFLANPPPGSGSGREEGPPTPSAEQRKAIEQAACQALGLLHPDDVADAVEAERQHYVGTFRIADSEGATLAAVAAYQRLVALHFYSFAEYKDAVHRATTLRKAYADIERRAELDDREQAFIKRFTIDLYSDDLDGYLSYLFNEAPGLSSILFGDLAVHLPEGPRRLHTYLLGTTGSGKSELLKAFIHSYIRDPNGPAVVVIEPSGDFVEQVAHWPELLGSERLVYVKLDLERGFVPTINPLEISGVDPLDTTREAVGIKQVVAQQLLSALEEILGERTGGDVTVNMRAVLMGCLLVLLDRPGATLRDLQRFMDKDRNADLVAFGASRTHFEGASSLFSGPFNQSHFDVTRRSIYAKLQTLFDVSFFPEMTCAKSTIDLAKALEARKIILFDLSKGRLGDEASAAVGRLVIAMIQAIAKRRGDVVKEQRSPIHLFIDECHNYLIPTVDEILVESRKLGLFLTLCQQSVGYRMGQEMRRIVTGMTNVKIAGKVEPDQWERTSRLFPLDTQAIRILGKAPKHERWFYIRAANADPFRFKARSDLIDFSHRMSPEMWRVTKARQLRAYYRSVEGDREPAGPPQGATTSTTKRRRMTLE